MKQNKATLKKNNLIFLHIPKNGGMTLHTILNRVFKNESIFDIKVTNNTRLNTDEFIKLPPKKRQEIKLLKGHMLFGLHQHLSGATNYITFLRKPEERLLSFYNYVKKRPKHRLYNTIFGNNLSFYDFVTTVDAGDIHNAQVRWISGLEHGSEEEMLEQALINIEKHFSFVGLLEQYNASLITLSKLYGWGVPYYKKINVGTYKKKGVLIDEKTKNAIAELNAGDLKLYQIIEKEFMTKRPFALGFRLKKLQIANILYSSSKFKAIRKLIKIT